MALGPRPLRTKQLMDRIQHFSPRSLYRYMANLTALELIDRQEEPGVPSTVILSLSDPAGRNLFRLLRSFAATSRSQLPDKGRDLQSWGSLNLLGELWGMGFAEDLSRGSRSLTELTRGNHEMTYHQVNRRTGLFIAADLLFTSHCADHGTRYELTDHGRRRMALIAGIGRWRNRYLLTGGNAGLTIAEMATVLRVALPLTLFPRYAGMSIELGVSSAMDENGCRDMETLQGTIDSAGAMRCDRRVEPSANGSAMATVNTWLAALLDGRRGRVQVNGDLGLVDACLTQLTKCFGKKS